MSKPQSRPEFRTFSEPRRHVPKITHNGADWVMSVRDCHNNLHTRVVPNWHEAKLHAQTWAHVNHAHGLTANEPLHGWLA